MLVRNDDAPERRRNERLSLTGVSLANGDETHPARSQRSGSRPGGLGRTRRRARHRRRVHAASPRRPWRSPLYCGPVPPVTLAAPAAYVRPPATATPASTPTPTTTPTDVVTPTPTTLPSWSPTPGPPPPVKLAK
ncbi:MAG: hypothetical protein R2838_05890 [Caldilineaceae bacterium]